MKIRYVLKHFVFRISRAFYHARKFLAVFGLCLILLVSLFATSVSAGELPKNHYWADNVGLFYSQDDMNMVGKPTTYFLRNDVESGFYRMWYRFSADESFSSYTFKDLPYSTTLQSKIFDLHSVFNRATNGWTGVEIGIQTKYENDANSPYTLFNLFEIQHGQRVSFAMDLYADWGFKKYDKCYAILRCTNALLDYDVFYIIGWYDFSKIEGRNLSIYFDFENNTGNYLRPVGIYFFQEPTLGKSLGGTIGMGNIKYHVFTEDEKALAQYNDIVNNQTEQIIGSIQSWNGEGTPPAGGDVVGQLGSAEDKLMADQSAGLEKTNEIFSSIGTQLEQFGPAFKAVSAFVNDLFGVSLFSFLITLSLALGIISLLLNLAPSIKSSIEGNKRREVAQANQEKRNAYYESRTAYYQSRKKK